MRRAVIALLLVALVAVQMAHAQLAIPNDLTGAVDYTEKEIQVPAFQSTLIQGDFYLRCGKSFHDDDEDVNMDEPIHTVDDDDDE